MTCLSDETLLEYSQLDDPIHGDLADVCKELLKLRRFVREHLFDELSKLNEH